MADNKQAPRKLEPLPHQPLSIFPIEHAWVIWGYIAPGITPLEDFLKPEAWAHVQQALTPRDEIHIKSEAGLYSATLEVERKFTGGATVRVIREWRAPKVDKAAILQNTGLRVEWGGPTHRYRIVDDATGEVARHGFATEADAVAQVPEVVRERRAA